MLINQLVSVVFLSKTKKENNCEFETVGYRSIKTN